MAQRYRRVYSLFPGRVYVCERDTGGLRFFPPTFRQQTLPLILIIALTAAVATGLGIGILVFDPFGISQPIPPTPQSHPQITVAASDASDLAKAQADFVCDGVHDEVEIQAAFDALPAAGGEVVLTEGTFHLAPPDYGGVSPPSHSTLRGQGEDKTVLHFSTFRSSVKLDREYADCADFTITGTGHLSVYSSHHTIRNVTVYDVDGSFQNSFYLYANSGRVVEDIEFDNCKAIDCDRWGFGAWGYGKVKNIRYLNCQAINCGRYGQFDGYGDGRSPADCWDVGFSPSETCSAEDVLLLNCCAEGCWESGFHTEYSPSKTIKNLRYVNCVSRNNGQKEKTGAGKCHWGAGFSTAPGVVVENCTSENNKYGYYSLAGGCEFINCRDTGSYMGFVLSDANDPSGVNIRSCDCIDEAYPVYIRSTEGTAPGSVVVEDLAISRSGSFDGGYGIYIHNTVQNAGSVRIEDSIIEGSFEVGIFNQAKSGKATVKNVTVIGARTDFINVTQ